MNNNRRRIPLWIASSIILIHIITHLFIYQARAAGVQTEALNHKVYLPYISRPKGIVSPPPPGDWLAHVNYYRALAKLPEVVENPEYSHGDFLHARYMVKNDTLVHFENPNNPWYTPEGDAAAGASNLVGSYFVNESDDWAIETWMQAPFHAIGLLDTALYEVGYGSYREADGELEMGAAIDVLRGLGSESHPEVLFPIIWPSDGMAVPLQYHWGEYPSPLDSCPGYNAPAGLPLIVQIGPGDKTPNVTAHALLNQSGSLEHCVFDETSYKNPDPSAQSLGRSILGARDAIVIIP
ncbi:MAG: CAP domain-containing protein, partial [Anaerolineales bacterium]